jgi:hypothetical protein
MKLGEALYKQSGGGAGPADGSDGPDVDAGANDKVERDELDDIMDAEFEEVKDDDKKKS